MIPAFIVNFNRLTAPRAMVEYLHDGTGCEPIILDNGSDYPPLLEWYDTRPCAVIKLGANYGNCALWFLPGLEPVDGCLASYDMTKGYILSDPDLDLSGVPKNFLGVLQAGLVQNDSVRKVGLSLEINDLPDTEVGREARGWEQMNWVEVAPGYCKAPVDTTFALYRWITPNWRLAHDFDRSWRTQRPYTARHLPWYYSLETIPEDEVYYLKHVSAHYNHYSVRLRKMLWGDV
jgi:hypothetical protein